MTDLIGNLSQSTRMWRTDVYTIIHTAPRRYKVYDIPKRNGEYRTIAHPARELKCLQRALLRLSPENLGVHKAATAYEKGTSILANANVHAKCVWLAKFDFSDFFNSISSHDWNSFLNEKKIDEEYREISSKLFFWLANKRNAPCLSVGAPSSPFVSNRIMESFDLEMSAFCDENGLKYTRYADDIAISSLDKINMGTIEKQIYNSLPEYITLNLNDGKTKLIGPGQRKSVTGLIINNDGKVSIGRKRKRVIEAMAYNYSVKKADIPKDVVQGNLAFLRMVDPDGYERIKKRIKGKGDLF